MSDKIKSEARKLQIKLYNRKLRESPEYRAKDNERRKQYAKDHPEQNKGRIRTQHDKEWQKEYRKQNAIKAKEYNKKYRTENKDKLDAYLDTMRDTRNEQSKIWRKNHPDKVKEYSRRRRAKKRLVNEHYTTSDERYTLALFHHKCFICGSFEDLTIDHHLPLHLGNALTRNNAVVLCGTCNQSKFQKLPENFYTKEKLLEIHLLLGVLKLLPPHI